ncbi:hypothetical protein [Chryseobacterium sp. SIMBA_029]|uniref:hypothetical protein n=1 Tax=Chryseobacterium sp. SIMBA_029 TaxID=3085772 RepID=UPI00397B2428
MKNKLIKYKAIWLVIWALFLSNNLFAQCENKYNSLSIIQYVHQRKLLLLPEGYTLEETVKYPSMSPKAIFDKNKCKWLITSKNYRGMMQNNNAYTVETIFTIGVSSSDGKIASKKIRRKKYRNYEK